MGPKGMAGEGEFLAGSPKEHAVQALGLQNSKAKRGSCRAGWTKAIQLMAWAQSHGLAQGLARRGPGANSWFAGPMIVSSCILRMEILNKGAL